MYRLIGFVFCMLLAKAGYSGTVYSCHVHMVKYPKVIEDKIVKPRYCRVGLLEGQVGDQVEIRSKSGYAIAIGKIVFKSGRSTTVQLSQETSEVHSGDAVSLKSVDDPWPASAAPF